MELGTVSAANMIGMVCLILVGVVIPIFLMIYGTKKLRAQMASFTLGALTYTVVVIIIKSLVNSLVVGSEGGTLKDDTILYALYVGASAAVFEEVGRFFVTKRYLRDRMNAQNSIMFGFGYGSLEAILALGFVGIEYLVASVFVNAGMIADSFKDMDAATLEESINAIKGLWEASPSLFYVESIDGIFIMLMHVALSVIIYKGLKDNKNEYIVIALVSRFLIEAGRVILRENAPSVLAGAVIWVVTIALICYAVKVVSDEYVVIKDKKLVMEPVGGFPKEEPKKEEPKVPVKKTSKPSIKQILESSNEVIETIETPENTEPDETAEPDETTSVTDSIGETVEENQKDEENN